MGLKFARMEGSRFFFLSSGCTTGMLSEVQFVGRRCLTTSKREERDTGSKWSRTAGHRKGAGSGVALVWASLSADTFSITNLRNVSQRVVNGTIGETSHGLMIELRTLKRT